MTVSSPPAAETAAPPMIWVATAKLAGSLLLAAAAVLIGSRGVPLGSRAGILAGLAGNRLSSPTWPPVELGSPGRGGRCSSCSPGP